MFTIFLSLSVVQLGCYYYLYALMPGTGTRLPSISWQNRRASLEQQKLLDPMRLQNFIEIPPALFEGKLDEIGWGTVINIVYLREDMKEMVLQGLKCEYFRADTIEGQSQVIVSASSPSRPIPEEATLEVTHDCESVFSLFDSGEIQLQMFRYIDNSWRKLDDKRLCVSGSTEVELARGKQITVRLRTPVKELFGNDTHAPVELAQFTYYNDIAIGGTPGYDTGFWLFRTRNLAEGGASYFSAVSARRDFTRCRRLLCRACSTEGRYGFHNG